MVRCAARLEHAIGSISCWFFFSSRRRHTRFDCDWSSDVCSSDLVQEPVQQSDVDESYVRPGNKKHSGAFHVDAGGGGGSQGTVAQHYEFGATRVTCACGFENFLPLEVQESPAHRPPAANTF